MLLIKSGTRCLALITLAAVTAAGAAEAPRPWPANPFLPVTEERIAALPAAEQPAWRNYWAISQSWASFLPARDLVDHSATAPLPGPPLGASYSKGVRLDAPAAWYATEEARKIADHVVNWQTIVGFWTKNGDYSRDRRPEDDHHDAWSAGTFDNDSTIYEMRFLALVNAAAPAEADTPRTDAWRMSFLQGAIHLLQAQYPNGGFPQIYPLVGWYHDAITFNDDAMVHILELLRDIAGRQAEFAFVPPQLSGLAQKRLERGIQCVLATQIRAPDGTRTVWGQQHDALTLQPCAARNFEPISECSRESAGLVQFLMTVPHPSPEIIAAVDGTMQWFPRRALHNVSWDRNAPAGTDLQSSPGAPDLWSRFYEFGTGKPIYSERDRMIHYTPAELSFERRKGYAWFNTRGTELLPLYAEWKKSLAVAK